MLALTSTLAFKYVTIIKIPSMLLLIAAERGEIPSIIKMYREMSTEL